MWVIAVSKAGLFRDLFGPFDTAQIASNFLTQNMTVPADCSCTVTKVKSPSELHPDWPAPKREKTLCWNCASVTTHTDARCNACGMMPL